MSENNKDTLNEKPVTDESMALKSDLVVPKLIESGAHLDTFGFTTGNSGKCVVTKNLAKSLDKDKAVEYRAPVLNANAARRLI